MITSTPKSGLLYHFDASRISVVAEVACSHDGRLGDLLKLIDGVKNSGADLIQFQLFKTSNLIHES
jgi:sialic acid synthase SpsE